MKAATPSTKPHAEAAVGNPARPADALAALLPSVPAWPGTVEAPAACADALQQKTPAPRLAQEFSVGDRVIALWEDRWYPGVVAEVLTGQYDIAWDDEEDVNNVVLENYVRAAFSVGDHVSALWDGNWYPGVVDKVLEGEYDIAWDGEEVNNKVPVEDVRALHPPPPPADLEAAADAEMSEAWPAGVLPHDELLAQLEQLGLGQFDALQTEARHKIVARAATPDAMPS